MLVVGVLVGISAFAGAFVNWNFMMAGAASTNPVMFAISMLLILAWKTAGWWGVDRWLLPAVGTPWQAGGLFRRRGKAARPKRGTGGDAPGGGQAPGGG